MSTKLWLAIAAIAAAALAAATVASATSGDITSPHTVRVTAINCGLPGTQCNSVDEAPAGTSVGDEFAANVPLVRGDRRVGIHLAHCTVVDTTGNGRAECSVTNELRGGTMVLEGILNFGGPGTRSVFAVTGGTGIYRSARGQAHVTATASGNLYDIHLIL